MTNRKNNGKPNILWLVLDCGRFDRISAHGYHRATTPNLDRLITEGLDFTNAYSAAVWSLPSYTSLLTGLYPREHGVNVSGNSLSADVEPLSQKLAQGGYTTACFSNNAWLSPSYGMDAGFGSFSQMWFSAQKNVAAKAKFLFDRGVGYLSNEADKGARRTNHELIRWLKEQNEETPFFAFVAYVEPHAPQSIYKRSLSKMGLSNYQAVNPEPISSSMWVECLPAKYDFSDAFLEDLNLRYDSEMFYLDQKIGLLLDRLSAEGMLDNTVVIITADHGELLGEHDMLGHQFSVHEKLRHVPLIIWAPNIWQQSHQINDVVQTLDIGASICQWADVSPLSRAESCYCLPEQSGRGERTLAFTDYPEPYLQAVRRRYPNVDLSRIEVGLTCVSNANYKVTMDSAGKFWGIDIQNDPDEKCALQIDSEPILINLQKQLFQFIEGMPTITIGDNDIPKELESHLRALGYLA